MPEQGARTETYRAGAPLRCAGVTLLPIERTVVVAAHGANGLWCWSDKAPYALAIRDGRGWRAVDLDDVALPLDRLREKVPGLDTLLGAP